MTLCSTFVSQCVYTRNMCVLVDHGCMTQIYLKWLQELLVYVEENLLGGKQMKDGKFKRYNVMRNQKLGFWKGSNNWRKERPFPIFFYSGRRDREGYCKWVELALKYSLRTGAENVLRSIL